MNKVLEICHLINLSKTFQNGEKSCPVEEAHLIVKSGDFIAITGPSGTGKSTLLNMMAGLMKPTTGDVILKGQNLYTLPARQLEFLRSQNVGMIFQETLLFSSLTVLENVEMAIRLYKRELKKEDSQRACVLLGTLGLENRLSYLPHEVSVGQRRRVLIARALVNPYSLILADEPTNDLDEHCAEIVMELFRQFTEKGGAVVMVTHHPRYSSMCSKQYRLSHGRLTLCR